MLKSLGASMCRFLPSTATFGSVCSCFALTGIALDRYKNVVHSSKQNWNPGPTKCMVMVILGWILAAGVASPMTTFFTCVPITVVYHNTTEPYNICMSFKKEEIRIYHMCLAGAIFSPAILLFLWLYYQIAQLIWLHRKFNQTQPSTISDTSTTTQQESHCNITKLRSNKPNRKIRTLKILAVLMFVFLLMRMPHFYNVFSLQATQDRHVSWILKYVFVGLVLLNCTLNPFLYVFLKGTHSVLRRICRIAKDFTCKVCCFCCSRDDFDVFEYENPFKRKAGTERSQARF